MILVFVEQNEITRRTQAQLIVQSTQAVMPQVKLYRPGTVIEMFVMTDRRDGPRMTSLFSQFSSKVSYNRPATSK